MPLINLNNTSNEVTINVTSADNAIAINLNPDSKNTFGSVLVYESCQRGMGAPIQVTLNLSGYLKAFKDLNASSTNIQLTVSYLNYNDGGSYSYEIKGNGIAQKPVSGNLSPFTSQMDSYWINIF